MERCMLIRRFLIDKMASTHLPAHNEYLINRRIPHQNNFHPVTLKIDLITSYLYCRHKVGIKAHKWDLPEPLSEILIQQPQHLSKKQKVNWINSITPVLDLNVSEHRTFINIQRNVLPVIPSIEQLIDRPIIA